MRFSLKNVFYQYSFGHAYFLSIYTMKMIHFSTVPLEMLSLSDRASNAGREVEPLVQFPFLITVESKGNEKSPIPISESLWKYTVSNSNNLGKGYKCDFP